MPKLTLDTGTHKFSAESKAEIVTIGEYVETLIVPLLLAAGFSQGQVTDYFESGEEK